MLSQKLALAAAGNAAAATYVDDVFSIDLYEGTGAAQTITNGIDLSGEGGMVWAKSRTSSRNHIISDTERGTGKVLFTNLNAAEDADSTTITSYNSNGFTMGTSTLKMNTSGEDFCSWTFRKCPGFFDVVTWTGDGTSGRTISHNLGSAPGAIFIKQTNSLRDWCVYHRGMDATNPSHYKLHLNKTDARADEANIFNDTEPTSSVFTVGSDSEVNTNGDTYVAYLFAHDDQSFGDDGDEAIIKCGSYTGDGTTNGSKTVTLGFEPQWILTRRSDAIDNWHVCDVMRGQTDNGYTQRLRANTNAAESANSGAVPTSTGFKLYSDNSNGGTFIYIAIRRPHKPPEAGTDVFDIRSHTSDVSGVLTSTTITADMAIGLAPDSTTYSNTLTTRLLEKYMRTESDSTANTGTHWAYDEQTGIRHTDWFGAQNILDYTFKRAPGFFDVVAYAGNSTSGATVPHNLGAVPELMIIKAVDGLRSWRVYDANTGASGSLRLNSSAAKDSNSGYWSTPTADNIVLGTDADTNSSSYDYIAYLFASLAGISKVGSYSGTGSTQNIDCGFTNGARFVLIKRTDSADSWHLFDTTQGISSGNDPFYRLDLLAAQSTGNDFIDPLSAGFTLATNDGAVNASGGTYIFLAIA
jgi:hypothetical protein